MPGWVDRERRTAQLVRACYDHYLSGRATADKLHALCRLTWITKSTDADADLPDNTPSVIAPALSTLIGAGLHAENPGQLARELRRSSAPEEVVRAASHPVGYTNFYPAFRNVARDWIEANRSAVARLLRISVRAKSDKEVRAVYSEVARLPPLPRPRAGDLPAFNLLTPVLACLDRRGKAPIINSRKAVRNRLSMLGLSSASLATQCNGLMGLIGQAGLSDAFALDTATDEEIERAMAKPGSRRRSSPKEGLTRPLGGRHDEDLEYLKHIDTVTMRRLHNRMTNALRSICAAVPLIVDERLQRECLYDALVRHYDGERHLLVEVKTDSSPAMCRLAVGQLMDYRRQLPDRAAIDLAVLLPERPPKEATAFFGYVGVNVIWFDRTMSTVRGEVRLG